MQYQLVLLLTVAGTLTRAANPVIGVAVSKGTFMLDDHDVPGNATIFDGARLQTARNTSVIRLPGLARLQLGQDSGGVVHRDHLKLEKGLSQIDTLRPYWVEALSFKIAAAQGISSTRISIEGSKTVRVAALTGGVRVANRDGVLIARLAAGDSLDFASEAGATAPSQIKGCLEKSGAGFRLTDETSRVTAELRGAGLASQVGSRVEVMGKMLTDSQPVEGATQVIEVLRLNRLTATCTVPRVAPGEVSSKSGILGMSKGTAVIAGVAVAAATTIPAIVLTRNNESKPLSPTSR